MLFVSQTTLINVAKRFAETMEQKYQQSGGIFSNMAATAMIVSLLFTIFVRKVTTETTTEFPGTCTFEVVYE